MWLTKQRLDELLTPRGGITRRTIYALLNRGDDNRQLPPWRHLVLGTWIADDHWQRCLETLEGRDPKQLSLF
jgi:hypothetical protein